MKIKKNRRKIRWKSLVNQPRNHKECKLRRILIKRKMRSKMIRKIRAIGAVALAVMRRKRTSRI